MCKRCRGLESILILILVSVIQAVLTMAPFFNKISDEISKLEGDDKLRGNLVEGNKMRIGSNPWAIKPLPAGVVGGGGGGGY